MRRLLQAVAPILLGALIIGSASIGAATASARPAGSGTIGRAYDVLTGSDTAGGDEFGVDVGISNSTLVVGAWKHDSDAGAAYVFVRSAGVWTQQAELTEPGGETAGDYFGSAVAISGNVAVVGADGSNSGDGAAYVFVRSGSSWTEAAALSASDGAPGDGFGSEVAISGDTVVVGADGHDNDTGAAYVFAKSSDGAWVQRGELTASDGADNDVFGASVAVSGSLILVGAYGHNDYTGAAYVFAKSGIRWAQQDELTGSDTEDGSDFGISVSLSGTTALVGSSGNNDATGAAYTFVQSGSTWSQQAELTASNGSDNTYFGGSVALSDGTAVVTDGPSAAPALLDAYVFVQSGTSWPQTEVLKQPKSDADGLWSPVALSGNTVAIGSWFANSQAGEVYVTK